MEINRATTLAKVLYHERALQAQERRDETIRKRGLSDDQVFPGSTKFQEAVELPSNIYRNSRKQESQVSRMPTPRLASL